MAWGVTFSDVVALKRVSRLVIGRRTEPGFPPYLRLVHRRGRDTFPRSRPRPTSHSSREARVPHQWTTTLSPVLTWANISAMARSSATLTQPCEAPA